MKFDIVVPLLGFPELKKVELKKFDEVFMTMQSLEDANLSFTLINPYVLRNYDFEVPENIRKLLEIDKDSNLLIYNIVLIQKPIENSYINFIAPLIFNTDTNKCAQILIQEENNYGVAEQFTDFLKDD
jgi:flagellar assembly factor FliW